MYVARRLQSLWRGRRARREALMRKVLRSGLDKFAVKIQRRYRAKQLGRRTQQQIAVVHNQQLDKYARMVQRGYRAKRAANVAQLIVAAKKRAFERETRAAVALQRRFRGLAGRKRVDLLRIQNQVRAREERDASLRIQTIYRGRADRKRAKELQCAREREIALLHVRATQLQAQFRRRKAVREAEARRQALRDRELAATKLQLAFRARHARQTVDVLRLTHYHRACEHAARTIQKRWRSRRDRIGLAIVLEVRRQRLERQQLAAIHLQRTFRRFLIRKRARSVMFELLKLQQNELDMEEWAATLVQALWRRRQAMIELERVQADKRTRWKQLIDTYNQHGKGYGAPFYYVRSALAPAIALARTSKLTRALSIATVYLATEPSQPRDPLAHAARAPQHCASSRLRPVRYVFVSIHAPVCLPICPSMVDTCADASVFCRATRVRERRVRNVRRVLL